MSLDGVRPSVLSKAKARLPPPVVQPGLVALLKSKVVLGWAGDEGGIGEGGGGLGGGEGGEGGGGLGGGGVGLGGGGEKLGGSRGEGLGGAGLGGAGLGGGGEGLGGGGDGLGGAGRAGRLDAALAPLRSARNMASLPKWTPCLAVRVIEWEPWPILAW